ncbi:MAG: hypothetical protein ACOYOT_05150 [Bacteroidales bacterium]
MLFLKDTVKLILNFSGFHTSRKIVVIESDDWGSIRMPSLGNYQNLKKRGVDIETGDNLIYNQNDTLERSVDLEFLFEVLDSVRDCHRNPAKMTAIAVVANPDFDKINENHFREYVYEPITETFSRYSGCEHSFDLWKEGVKRGIFRPQFHAREHLNVNEWMRALQAKDEMAHFAFNNGFWGYNNAKQGGVSFQAAFDFVNPGDLMSQAESIDSGLKLFEQLMGYQATYFVPTNGPFNNSLEQVAANGGISLMYGSRFQSMPIGHGESKTVYHYFGQRNQWNQRYIMRNVMFEPFKGGQDWIDTCLHDISFAFKCKQPAVICSHRVNYMGGLRFENRDQGLSQLKQLLKAIVRKWSDVEFMTTDQLQEIM